MKMAIVILKAFKAGGAVQFDMPMESSCPFSSFNATTCQLANSFPQQSIGPFVKAANNGICQTEVESTVCSLGKQIDRKVTGQGGQPGGHSLGNSHKRNNPIYILYCAIIRGTVRGEAKGSWFPPHSEAISRFQLHNNPTLLYTYSMYSTGNLPGASAFI